MNLKKRFALAFVRLLYRLRLLKRPDDGWGKDNE